MSATAPEGRRLSFLGPEWLVELGRAAGRVTLPPDLRLTLQQVVIRAGGTDVRYYLEVEGGRLSVQPGQAADPDLTLTQSYDLAVALSRGDTNAQLALSTGRLKVSGNVELLIRHARALAGMADVSAGLRHLTAY